MKKSLILIVLALIAGSVHAQKFSYNYAELGYGRTDIDLGRFDTKFEQLFVGYSSQIRDAVVFDVKLGIGEFDLDIDHEIYSATASFGGASQVGPSTSVQAGIGAGYTEIDIDGASGFDNDQGSFFAFFGARQWIVPGLEVHGELRATYIDPSIGDTDTIASYLVGVRAQPLPEVSVGVQYLDAINEDVEDTIGLTVRWIYDK